MGSEPSWPGEAAEPLHVTPVLPLALAAGCAAACCRANGPLVSSTLAVWSPRGTGGPVYTGMAAANLLQAGRLAQST